MRLNGLYRLVHEADALDAVCNELNARPIDRIAQSGEAQLLADWFESGITH